MRKVFSVFSALMVLAFGANLWSLGLDMHNFFFTLGGAFWCGVGAVTLYSELEGDD